MGFDHESDPPAEGGKSRSLFRARPSERPGSPAPPVSTTGEVPAIPMAAARILDPGGVAAAAVAAGQGARPTHPALDPLTGLPGATALPTAFREAVRRVADGSTAALILVDLCDFASVNELFGRDHGDAVLVDATHRIASKLGPASTLVRLGGDEFAAVTAVADPDQLDLLALSIIEAVRTPFEVRGYSVRVGADLGMALIDGASDLDTVRKKADMALYRARRHGPNRYEIFEHAGETQISPAIVADWLRSALDDEHLRLAYQPISSMSREVVVAVEALLRWEHPVEGLLLPDVVIPALEDSGLIVDVGEWVVNEACRQARIWRDATPHGMPPIVFVNVSPRHLMAADFLTVLERAITDHDIESGQLCLELGGMSSVSLTSHIWSLLRECKAIGVRLALDNFGSNESSYGLVRRLQLDYIKLDRHLTNARNATAHDDAITTSVVSLARSLGFTTVAQGIEDPASLERARSFGCDLVQGFYLGAADEPDLIQRQIANGRTASRTVFR